MTSRSLRALVSGLVDYAGLFPPAKLPMNEALRNYGRYRGGEYAWMLGNFVVPAAQLDEVPLDFPVSVLADEPRTFDREIAALEVKRLGTSGLPLFVEIPIADDPASLLDELNAAGARAKIRTGGITADAFPDVDAIARVIQRCAERAVAFKATAGLHHPLRCVRPLTYEADAPTGTMHGFLNVFIAALFTDAAREILLDDDPRSFAFHDEGLSWRDRRASVAEIERMRRERAISFGSCSFEEPIADLQALGWL